MNYVSKIIEKFGGTRQMARLVEKPPSTVRSWGERGSIPDKEKPQVLAAAQAHRIALEPADFFPAELVCVDGSDTSHAYTPAPSDGKPQENEVSNARGVTP